MNALEAADRLGCSERTIRRAISDGRLHAEKIGVAFVIGTDAVDAFGLTLRRPSRSAGPDPELDALAMVMNALTGLEPAARIRVLIWARERFVPEVDFL